MRRVLAAVVLFAVLACVPAWAQTTGQITGRIVDPTGVPLPGATVTVTSPALQAARTAVTDVAGTYRVPTLPPGTYTVRAELAGCDPTERRDVNVATGRTEQVDLTLSQTMTPAAAAGVPNDRWTGFYVTGMLGLWPRSADLGNSTETVMQVSGANFNGNVVNVPPATVPIPASSPSGWPLLTTLAGGYAVQYGSIVVAGEGGIDFAFGTVNNVSSTQLPATALTPSAPLTMERRASTQLGWSIRGRVGYAWEKFLFYGLVGTSMASLKLEAVDTWESPGGYGTGNLVNFGPLGPYVTTASDTQHKMGFTWGFGGEYALNDALSIGGEFRYTGFPTVNFGLGNPTVAINGPLPTNGATNAQALPGPMTIK
ncbi:MAG: carboxypeptidase regulatory-like domain-containing protein, partial [Bacteroidales bacterium]